MLLSQTLRLVAVALGAALYWLLAGLAVQRRRWGAFAPLAIAALWCGTSAAVLFLRAATGNPLAGWLLGLRLAAGALAGAAAAASAFTLAAAGRVPDHRRRFRLLLGAALAALPAAALAAGTDSAAFASAALAPGLTLAWFVYRYDLLGLRISRRLVFAVSLGLVFAVYLLLVKRVAEILEDEFDAFRSLVELALILAATLVWLPLYGWMTRMLSRRTQLYAGFSKRLIEEAARRLDLYERARFLEAEVRSTFGLRRALLVAGEPPPELAALAARVRQHRTEVLHAEEDPALARLGFSYLFPLWYEDRLNGLLLLDCSPRIYLDEDEAILLGLSRQISHSLETCRLVDEKISLERTLVQQEHLAGLGKVAAAIAHEIKNPLSSIKTLVQLMREDPAVEQAYGRDLNYIVAEVDRLNQTVQQLLSFSRPAPPLEGEVDVSALLARTADVLARQYEASGIRVEGCVEPNLRLKRAGAEIIQQIVLNLALNAVQASPAQSRVRLEAASEPGRVRIAVSDQGPGIPRELQEKIFEPFYTTKQKGAGLGLSIVRKNVRQLGGEIRVASPIENGRGARVEVVLPVE